MRTRRCWLRRRKVYDEDIPIDIFEALSGRKKHITTASIRILSHSFYSAYLSHISWLSLAKRLLIYCIARKPIKKKGVRLRYITKNSFRFRFGFGWHQQQQSRTKYVTETSGHFEVLSDRK